MAGSTVTNEKRGQVLDVLRELLSDGRDEAIVELVTSLLARNHELEARLADRLGKRSTSEAVSSAQLLLLLDELTDDERLDEDPRYGLDERLETDAQAAELAQRKLEQAQANKKKQRQPPVRKALPSHLRRVDNEQRVPDEQRPCPTCGAERTCIGHDLTEVVELIPAELIVRRDRREKLACTTCEAEIVRAPMGDKVVAGGRCGPTLVATMLVDKYRDGLPLHRQVERFGRMGWAMPVSTATDQVKWGAERLQPLWRIALQQSVQSTVMHLDATGMPVLDKQGPKGLNIGSMWGYVGDDPSSGRRVACVLYASTGKKKGQRPGELGPEDVLALRKGFTVADASNVFDASFSRPDLIECGCNMHARRYFKKALDAGDHRAVRPLAAFKRLYIIEDELRGLSLEDKREQRQERSLPVYDSLVAWCEGYEPYEPPASPMGKAIRYLLNHQLALRRFLEDGAIPIDNGVVERLHVRTALTRKNFLFVGSHEGGTRAAIVYTMLACCSLAEVDPVEYLADVLPRLGGRHRAAELAELMPTAWKAQRRLAAAE